MRSPLRLITTNASPVSGCNEWLNHPKSPPHSSTLLGPPRTSWPGHIRPWPVALVKGRCWISPILKERSPQSLLCAHVGVLVDVCTTAVCAYARVQVHAYVFVIVCVCLFIWTRVLVCASQHPVLPVRNQSPTNPTRLCKGLDDFVCDLWLAGPDCAEVQRRMNGGVT